MPSANHSLRGFLHDLYAPLSHVIGDGTVRVPRGDGVVPTWVDATDERRLLAYRALDAYVDNVHRFWLPPAMWQGDPIQNGRGEVTGQTRSAAESYREFGHPALLVNTARSLLLGEEQTVSPQVQTDADNPQVTWAVDWAEAERLTAKVLEAETSAIGLGDACYVLGWSEKARRPRLRVFDPGMYFPDWGALDRPEYADWDDEDYPPVVHLAWEYEDDKGTTYLRRTTWSMQRLATIRTVPWSDVPTSWRCVQRIEQWRTDRLRGETIYTLAAGSGTLIRDDTDLGIDFIPVIGLPNDYNKHRWGRSLLLPVIQLLDDLAAADTDLSVDAALVASPPTVTRGTTGPLESGPGAQWELGDGTANLLDTSRTLDALLKHADRLEDLLSTRSRVAAVLLGKVDPADAASGYAMRLGMAPTEALVSEMQRVRAEKYPLLLKMAVRLAQSAGIAGGGLGPGQTVALRLDLSSGLPTARQAVIEEVTALYTAHLISLQTAVSMLRDVGLPIADVAAEVARIVAADTAAAVQVVDATGDVPAARARLGLGPAGAPAGNPDPAVVDPAADPAANPAADPANPANLPI